MLVLTVSCAISRISTPCPWFFGHPKGMQRTHASRKPPAVREGRGRLGPPARAPRRGARALRPALRRRAVGGVLPRAGPAGARSPAGCRLRDRAGAGGGDHARARAGARPRSRPDLVLVYGDTNTTLAGALSCARLEIPLAHVESGMRSFDDSMPEERNRVLTDHLSELLLCSTPTAVENLAREGVEDGVELVGDVMADVTLLMAPVAAARIRRARAARRARRAVPARDGPPGGQRRRPRGPRPAGRACCSRCRCPPCFPVHPAHARAARRTPG